MVILIATKSDAMSFNKTVQAFPCRSVRLAYAGSRLGIHATILPFGEANKARSVSMRLLAAYDSNRVCRIRKATMRDHSRLAKQK